ncbi:hypothetical protein ALC60_07637, partial [Trachymyrmex zeteki]
IIFTKADKGNVTVALDLDEYKLKMNNMLNDKITYTLERRDPTRNLTTSVHNLLTYWLEKGYIDSTTYEDRPKSFEPHHEDGVTHQSHSVLPLVYGLPKIHKLDVIATAVPHNLINKFLEVFNASHPKLQFTLEIRGDRLNFLDVTLINDNGTLEFNVFHKLTFSGRYLSFLSPKYHEDNLNFIVNTFLENDYPMKFIFDTINSRLRSLLKHKTLKQADSDTTKNKEKPTWFTIPFLPQLYAKFKTSRKT